MANNLFYLKYCLIGLFILTTDFVICQTKIFTVDSVNFNEWNYNQRKIVRSPEIEILAESNDAIFYSKNLGDPVKIFDGMNASLAVDSKLNTHIVYVDDGIRYSFRNDADSWAPSLLIADSNEICSSPIADCDKEGNLHILYGIKDSSHNGSTHLSSLKYAKVLEGEQVISSIIYVMNEEANQDTLVNYTIATDLIFKDKSVFLVYQLSNDSIYVLHSINLGESWALSAVFPGTNPSLSVGFGKYFGIIKYDDHFPIIRDDFIYPVILYLDADSNLLNRYAEFNTVSKHFQWNEEKIIQNGPIEYLCIDDINPPRPDPISFTFLPFGYSYIFQKNGFLYHAFTNFDESIIMDTISNNATISSIAYKKFNSEKVDIVWYEKNDDTFEIAYQSFDKIPPEFVIGLTLEHVTCYGFCDGAVTPIFDNLCSGTYKLVVIDADGNSDDILFMIGEPAPLYLSKTVNNVTCKDSSNG